MDAARRTVVGASASVLQLDYTCTTMSCTERQFTVWQKSFHWLCLCYSVKQCSTNSRSTHDYRHVDIRQFTECAKIVYSSPKVFSPKDLCRIYVVTSSTTVRVRAPVRGSTPGPGVAAVRRKSENCQPCFIFQFRKNLLPGNSCCIVLIPVTWTTATVHGASCVATCKHIFYVAVLKEYTTR